MNNVFVTGGCGFIGANLVKKLKAIGLDVTIYDNFSKGEVDNIDSPDKYRIIEGDIRDYDLLDSSVKGHDAVVHLAAYGSVVESVSSPQENYDVNVKGTFNVLNAAKNAKIAQFIFASTGGALIGNAKPPVSENSIPRPISPYGASKLAGEGYCCAFSHSYGMSITALRFANVIGPVSWHKKGAVTAFIKAIINDCSIDIYGDGSATRDFLYVDDLCDGIVSSLKNKLLGFTPLHLASGREVSIFELADLVRKVADRPDYPINYLGKRTGEVERNFANFEQASSLLQFNPGVCLESGLEQTYNWFLEYAGEK